MALNADKKTRRTVVARIHPGVIVHRSSKETAQREPDRVLVEVPQPVESEPEPVAGKKKRSPEAIAKQKATLASKKRSRAASNGTGAKGEKAAFIRNHPDVPAPELVKVGKKQGLKFSASLVYMVRKADRGSTRKKAPKAQPLSHGPSPNGASIGELLQTIADSALEIKRRLSQLTL